MALQDLTPLSAIVRAETSGTQAAGSTTKTGQAAQTIHKGIEAGMQAKDVVDSCTSTGDLCRTTAIIYVDENCPGQSFIASRPPGFYPDQPGYGDLNLLSSSRVVSVSPTPLPAGFTFQGIYTPPPMEKP